MSESSIGIAKKKIEKVGALLDYYEDLKGRQIADGPELKDVKSKMAFTQKEIMKLCLETKKIIKDSKEKDLKF